MSNKVTIIGAGSVGSTIAYTMAVQGLVSEIVMIDVNTKKALGEAMDIRQGTPFMQPCKIYAGSYEDAAGSDIVIVTSGIARKPGQTRLELCQINVNILKSITPQIVKYAPDALYVFVSNPVDVLTYAAWRLSGFPAHRVIGSGTVLDTARLKQLLGQYLRVDSRNVHAFIIGEHGDSELAVWSSANISGIDLEHFCALRGCSDHRDAMERLYQGVRDSAYEIIARKGATYYGIAMAVRRIAECIIKDEQSVLPVSVVLQGEYGLDGLCLSIPSILGKNGLEKVLEIPLDRRETDALTGSAAQLRQVIRQLSL